MREPTKRDLADPLYFGRRKNACAARTMRRFLNKRFKVAQRRWPGALF
jgi:hypothetical protein